MDDECIELALNQGTNMLIYQGELEEFILKAFKGVMKVELRKKQETRTTQWIS